MQLTVTLVGELNGVGMSDYACRICGSTNLRQSYVAREMMFGTREEFRYEECADCSSLQIDEIPDAVTLSRHYPENYYSFSSAPQRMSIRENLVRWLVLERDRASLGRWSVTGRMLKFMKPAPSSVDILKSAGIRNGQQVLDVGCGAGALLDRLSKMGFDGLLGVDAFVDADMITSSGVPIKKRRLSEVEGEFDLIMFHHSFEHVPSPRDELQEVHRRLRPGGRCLIRIPTPSSEAWEKYGTDWVQLDAPRHLTLISRPGMTALAQQCGFSIAEEIDDSIGWSFMASELYRRDIPLREQSQETHFSPDEISTYEKRATAANAAGRGDQAAFILVRS